MNTNQRIIIYNNRMELVPSWKGGNMILYQIHAIKENKMNRRKIDYDTAWSNQFWFSNEEDALSYCKTMQQVGYFKDYDALWIIKYHFKTRKVIDNFKLVGKNDYYKYDMIYQKSLLI
mgnify:FL=1